MERDERTLRLRRSAPRVEGVGQTANRIGLLYETHIAVLLEHMGYLVDRTPVTGDGGADLLAYPSPSKGTPAYAVQCKAWDGPVGISAVQEIYTARALVDADHALLVVSSTLTPDAEASARFLSVLTASVGIVGEGSLPVPAAANYQRPGAHRIGTKEAEGLAMAEIADRLKLTAVQRRQWTCRADSTELVRVSGVNAYRVSGTFRGPPLLWTARNDFVFSLDLDAQTAEVLRVDLRRAEARKR